MSAPSKKPTSSEIENSGSKIKKVNRRQAFLRLGLGGAGLFVGARGMAAVMGSAGAAAATANRVAGGAARAQAQDAGTRASLPPAMMDSLDDLARRISEAPRRKALEVAAAAIEAGADHRALLGAVFLAGVQDLRPHPVGGRMHAVMMVESAFQLADLGTSKEALLAALWNIDEFKNSQEEQQELMTWALPARPDIKVADEAAARRELIAALESWDAERADRAVVGFLPHVDRTALFEILWPYSGRCIEYLGHKIIYAAQIERAIGRIGWRWAEPAVRSLVRGLVNNHGEPLDQANQVALELAPQFPRTWLAGREDPAQSQAILRRLRQDDMATVQWAVVAAFKDGLGPGTVWDGLRLFASEMFLRRLDDRATTGEAIRAVHPVTELHAFGDAWLRTSSDATRRLLILQAAGWMVQLREGLLVRKAISMQGPAIDTLGQNMEDEGTGLEEILARPSAAGARSFLERSSGADDGKYLARLRQLIFLKATESHQYKYAAAIQEEYQRVHPTWVSRMLAPAIPYLPATVDPDTDLAKRSVKALRKAGVETG